MKAEDAQRRMKQMLRPHLCLRDSETKKENAHDINVPTVPGQVILLTVVGLRIQIFVLS